MSELKFEVGKSYKTLDGKMEFTVTGIFRYHNSIAFNVTKVPENQYGIKKGTNFLPLDEMTKILNWKK